MNITFDTARIHRAELDQEIEAIRTERFLRRSSPQAPGPLGRAKAGIGRGLISLGTSLVGAGEAAAAAAAPATGSKSRA